MTDTTENLGRKVVDFLFYQQARSGKAPAMSARACRHCGAALMDGESENDCSTLGVDMPVPRKLRAD